MGNHGARSRPGSNNKMIVPLPMVLLLVLIYAAQAQESFKLADFLPEDPSLYDRLRPPTENGSAAIVDLRVFVMGLNSIDENSMTFVADIDFVQTWKDNRLRHPINVTPDEYGLFVVDTSWLDKIWRPDSYFKNAKFVSFQTMTIPNHKLWIYEDGTISYLIKLTMKLSCAMNFFIYPHDIQECKLQIESLWHLPTEMTFQWAADSPLQVINNIELPQLRLDYVYLTNRTVISGYGASSCLEAVFVLSRRIGYYLFHTYIPTCLIVIISWISFWIKPEAAPQRVTLGITSLLTLSTQHAKSQASLPPVSYLKAVDVFMFVCTIFVCLVLVEVCIVHIVFRDSDPPAAQQPPPPHPSAPAGPLDCEKSDKIFDIATKRNRSSVLIIDRSQKSSAEAAAASAPPPGPTPAQRARMRALNIDRVSRVLFPFLFAALNVVYWCVCTNYVLTGAEMVEIKADGQYDDS